MKKKQNCCLLQAIKSEIFNIFVFTFHCLECTCAGMCVCARAHACVHVERCVCTCMCACAVCVYMCVYAFSCGHKAHDSLEERELGNALSDLPWHRLHDHNPSGLTISTLLSQLHFCNTMANRRYHSKDSIFVALIWNRTRPRVLVHNRPIRELICAWNT